MLLLARLESSSKVQIYFCLASVQGSLTSVFLIGSNVLQSEPSHPLQVKFLFRRIQVQVGMFRLFLLGWSEAELERKKVLTLNFAFYNLYPA